MKDFESELEELGKRIQQIRKHRKLKLLNLEVLSGINASDIGRFERGTLCLAQGLQAV